MIYSGVSDYFFAVGCDIYGLFRSYLVVGTGPLKLDGGFVSYLARVLSVVVGSVI